MKSVREELHHFIASPVQPDRSKQRTWKSSEENDLVAVVESNLLAEGLPSVVDDHGLGPWDRSQANPYRLSREAYSNTKAK